MASLRLSGAVNAGTERSLCHLSATQTPLLFFILIRAGRPVISGGPHRIADRNQIFTLPSSMTSRPVTEPESMVRRTSVRSFCHP